MWRVAAATLALSTLVVLIGVLMKPWTSNWTTYGFHDWDVQTAHRYLVKLSLLRYHEFPGWNPFACGGFPAWGYVEADTVIVSPFLPLYLALPMPIALRLEVAAMAVLAAAGAYAAASRFSESHSARALVAVLWALNGRWALQTAAGHTWHLDYAYLGWALFFFERARQRDRRLIDVLGLAGMFAMLVYSGGIYPLPHTALALGLYALLLAIANRELRPITTLAMAGAVGIGLAAPKLLPLLDGFGKAPRIIESKESLDLGALVTMLTSRDQAFFSRPARVTPYGWHEWGIYVGAPGLALLVLGFALVGGRRERVLKVVACVLALLGMGAFHPYAPWSLLHLAPVFKSQHVPSRFLYPAILFFALVLAAGIGRLVARHRLRWPWLDLALGAVVLAIAVDVGSVGAKSMANAMWMVPPDRIAGDAPFHYEQDPPYQYKRRDWVGPMYLSMLGNTGVINCYGTPPFDRKGAVAVKNPRYRGEAWLDGSGTARVASFSPNEVVVETSGAAEGERLVLNMNFDEGWHVDAGHVESFHDALAVKLGPNPSRVRLSYTPPYFGAGLLICAVTIALIVLAWRRRKRYEDARW